MNSLLKSQRKLTHDNQASEQSVQSGQLITILGPTATGKSHLAMQLAGELNAEIICADSRTVYRDMDIGTAKPSQADQAEVRHHLLDICNPDEIFSAQEFVLAAQASLKDIWSRGKTALVVGGSGMYIDALLFGYQFRQVLDKKAEGLDVLTLEELVQRAQAAYPEDIKDIDRHNRRRVEQLLTKGPSKDEDREMLSLHGPVLGLDKPDDVLKATISSRTQFMLQAGLVNEARSLVEQYGVAAPGLQTTGYREVVAWLGEDSDEGVLAEMINKATWRLVRKQRTWFKRNNHIEWVNDFESATVKLKKNGYNV